MNTFTKVSLLACLLLLTYSALGQSVTVQGRVLDAQTEEPLPGATVRVGRTTGVATTTDGRFQLSLGYGQHQLLLSSVGYENETINLILSESSENPYSLEVRLEPSTMLKEEVIVRGVRASEETPTTFTMVTRQEIEDQNLGQDLPFLLDQEPSVVVTSDAGAGVGYTGIRIRGSDPTRVNVTINGIPVNDAESHGVFWVNLPDFASSVESMQIQRGVGTSTNGAGAFGGSINIQTTTLNEEPYAKVDNSVGSFNTRKHTLRVGSGLVGKWSFDARLSKINSDGYIDRAFSDLRSYYVSAGYHGDNTLLKAIHFSGDEQTYQAWYGVYEDVLATDRTYNLSGTDYGARATPYDNETDNYGQDYYQLLWGQRLGDHVDLQTALHWTHGEGYFEQYKVDDALSTYGIDPVVVGGTSVTNSDVIRRLWLDNDYYGVTYALHYTPERKLEATLGGAWYRYDGRHFGELVWARFAGDSEIRDQYYFNEATKTDLNVYAKALYRVLPKLQAYVDLQVRQVGYDFLGYNRNLENVQQQDRLTFFNPKVGATYQVQPGMEAYASYSVGSREPTRNDYTESTPDSRPAPERMQNVEAGFRKGQGNWQWSANVYGMFYRDQLVLTGAVNDVGAFVRVNVPESYRAGIELSGAWKSTQLPLTIQGNVALSRNKIAEYTEFVPVYDDTYSRVDSLAISTTYRDTDLAFSPNVVGGATVTYEPITGLELTWQSKYVGAQYLDNTMSASKQLDAFWVNHLRVAYGQTLDGGLKEWRITAQVNNIFNELYEPNGYTFSEAYLFDDGTGNLAVSDPTAYNYYYPQAGTNFLVAVSLSF